MQRYVGIGDASEALGVSIGTLRRWERTGKLVGERTPGGHRRYDLAKLRPERFRAEEEASRRTTAFARVSSHDQRDDLERQQQLLELYCARQGWTFEVVSDLGSGMNYHKKGLKKLLDAIVEGSVGRLVVTRKRPVLAAVRLRPDWIFRSGFTAAARAASRSTAISTPPGISKDWPQALRRLPVEECALARLPPVRGLEPVA